MDASPVSVRYRTARASGTISHASVPKGRLVVPRLGGGTSVEWAGADKRPAQGTFVGRGSDTGTLPVAGS